METVGERIRFVRNKKKLTLEELASRAGVSRSFLWDVEQSRSGISGRRLLQVANALGASLDYLMRGVPAQARFEPGTIEIPRELSEVAEEKGLSHKQTLALLDIQRSIVARRGRKDTDALSNEDWKKLYQGVEEFLRDSS